MLSEIRLMKTLEQLRDKEQETWSESFVHLVGWVDVVSSHFALRTCARLPRVVKLPFVSLRVAICEGTYPSQLITAWEEWGQEHESENDHPGTFSSTQVSGGNTNKPCCCTSH